VVGSALKDVWISIDVEPDISNYLSGSFLGIHAGLPGILGILKDHRIIADFFVLGEVAESLPDAVRRIFVDGHVVGSHSLTHRHICEMTLSDQVHAIQTSIDSLTRITGQPTKMFRAPNFSANGNTVRALAQVGVPLDSSVLPGRYAPRWKIRKTYDHRRAPRAPYRASVSDVDAPGQSSVIEVPVTENPLQPRTPIGLGFLNSHSVEETLKAISVSDGAYAAFLIHPWEAVDLSVQGSGLPAWLGSACKSDLKPLDMFLKAVSGNAQFTTISQLRETVLAREAALHQ